MVPCDGLAFQPGGREGSCITVYFQSTHLHKVKISNGLISVTLFCVLGERKKKKTTPNQISWELDLSLLT